MKRITIIVPCFNEEENIGRLCQKITEMTLLQPQYSWKTLFVDDGSTDGTIEKIIAEREKNGMFSLIALSRNFGKEQAILAGLDNVSCDCAIIMDADLQHPVSAIPLMIEQWEKGFDDVYAKRLYRGKESWIRRKLSLAYYKILQKMAKIDILPNVGDFRLLDRKCIEALKSMRETQRYTKGLYCWIGFKKKEITINQEDRTAGKSSFNYIKLLNLAIEGITSYTTTPLRMSTIFGLISSLSAFIYMIFVFIKTIFFGEAVQGFPTIIIIILFLGGIQLISLGVIGEYLGRIFHETKRRPNYFIREKSLTPDPSPKERGAR